MWRLGIIVFDFAVGKPIYLQIAEWLENEILKGNIKENEQLPSQMDIAEVLSVNPMTAGKGVSVLESRGVLEKRKRGCGIYVLQDAKSRIYEYRKNERLNGAIDDLLTDAAVLGMSVDELCELLKKRGGGKQ